MPGRFLVAVDFSRLTEPTIAYAVKLATGSGHQIDLFHVVVGAFQTPNLGNAVAQDLVDRLTRGETEGAQKRLRELMESSVPESMRGDCLIGEGPPAEAINTQAAVENRYEMVVVSTNGRTGLQHILLGSVAERVVRHAKVPVLVVR